MLLGNSGFDAQNLQEGDLILPIRHGGNLVAPACKAREELVLQARLDGNYGHRWKCETVHNESGRRERITVSCSPTKTPYPISNANFRLQKMSFTLPTLRLMTATLGLGQVTAQSSENPGGITYTRLLHSERSAPP